MYTIQTRENRKGNWWCNGTLKGYDYSFEGATIENARELMTDFLIEENIDPRLCNWEQPKQYPNKPASSKFLFERHWLDFNPLG